MDIKYLNYILTIAKKRNMTKAAEELYVSQSSLSQYLAKLEQELKTPLFFRAKGELILTPAGELYIKAAQEVVQIQKKLYQNISSINMRGHINVGTTSLFGLRVLSEILPIFNKQYPEYLIEISETSLPQLKKLLLEENIDLGIMATASVTPFEEYSEILREEEILLALPKNHEFVSKYTEKSITAYDIINELSEDIFIHSKRGSSIRAVTDSFFEQKDFRPKSLCESNSILTTRDMIAKGLGFAFIAESCASDTENIQYYSLSPLISRKNILTKRRNWIMNDAEKLFYEMIKEYFSKYIDKEYRV